MLSSLVMRACEGCRRRKIKCDAATSNQWPCAACVRLKLHCAPPTVDYDRNHPGGGHLSGLERVLDFDNGSGGDDDFHNTTSGPSYYDIPNPHDQLGEHQLPFSESLGAFHTPPYSERAPSLHDYSYEEVPTIQLRSESFHEPNNFKIGNGQTYPARGHHVWSDDQYSTVELADVLGELKIHESGEGMFTLGSPHCTRRALSFHKPHIFRNKRKAWRKHQPGKKLRLNYQARHLGPGQRSGFRPSSCLQRNIAWNGSRSSSHTSIPTYQSSANHTSINNGTQIAGRYRHLFWKLSLLVQDACLMIRPRERNG